jgi:2-polyprenyl-3-methyl-5-hydroxy-6-metoxy-1,4-benzoquinol methylase
MTMQRRTFLAAAGAAAAATAAQSSNAAAAPGELVDIKIDPWNQPPELAAKWDMGGLFLQQDDESRQDFTRGMARFLSRDSVRPEAQAHQAAFLKSKGINPLDDVNMDGEQAFNLLVQDPAYAARTRLARTNFHIHWDNPRRAFYRDANYFLGELDKTDKIGPGRLELNPALDIPDSARHEIHSMPGGYVGEAFAGWLYELGHVSGTDDLRDRGRSIAYGQTMTLPADRKVTRILDIGCSMGDSTLGLKARFPNAEVWGIDVGAPLLRYAHYRAVKLGYDVNYSQRNAESTGFPDAHFDAIGSCIVFHEISPEARPRVVKEIFRLLRPGGVYHHVDFITAGHPKYTPTKTITGLAGKWVDHRHNVETWSPAYQTSDFPGLMRSVGFDVDFSGPPTGNSKTAQHSFPGVAGIKPIGA